MPLPINCYLGKTARATSSVYCPVRIKVGRGDEPVLCQMLRAWAVIHSPPYCTYRKNELRTRERGDEFQRGSGAHAEGAVGEQ